MKKIISVILTVAFICGSLAFSSQAAERYNYIILGDSIAFGSGLVNATEACYGKMVADTCGFEYANYSVPGDTTSQLIGRLKIKAVRDAISKADIISISIGGNDFLDELSDLMYDFVVERDYTDFDRVAFGVYTNLTMVIETIRELNGDAVILLQTLYNPMSGYLKDGYQYGADCVNDAINRCAKENKNVKVADVASSINGDDRNFADDTMHPSAKGNRIIARVVLDSLKKLGYTKKNAIDVDTVGVDVELGSVPSQMLEYYAFMLHALAVALDAYYLIAK